MGRFEWEFYDDRGTELQRQRLLAAHRYRRLMNAIEEQDREKDRERKGQRNG